MFKLLRLRLPYSFQRIPIRFISSKEKTQEGPNLPTKETSEQQNKFPEYVVSRATQDHFDSILDLMHQAYYPSEPLLSSLKVKPTKEFDEYTIKSLSQGISLMARCKYTGKILGVLINGAANPWDLEVLEALICNTDSEKIKHFLRFCIYVQRKPDLWRKYGVQTIFEMQHLAVRSEQRNKNLGLVLMTDGITLAANCGYALVKAHCSSLYSAKLCQKLGMQLVQEIPYNTYLDQDNKPIFNPPEPHTELKTYVVPTTIP